MSEEKNKKNFRRASLLKYLILIGALILVLIYVIIPRVMDWRRRINIAKDLENVYPGCEIDEVKCDKKPTYESDLEESYEWFVNAFPEEGLYHFLVFVTEDRHVAQGYATKDGTVVYDSCAALYYNDASASYFEAVVDFEHNFPGLDYYISKTNINSNRYVQTHECTTFEKYRTGTVGGFAVSLVATNGYPEILVGIVDGERETVKEIKKILKNADFDIAVSFASIEANASGEYDAYSFGESLGKYIPFREIEDRNYHLENDD